MHMARRTRDGHGCSSYPPCVSIRDDEDHCRRRPLFIYSRVHSSPQVSVRQRDPSLLARYPLQGNPENITSFFSGWNEEQFKDSAQYALFLTLNQNKRVLTQTAIPTDKEMDQVVESNKTTQFMFEKVKLTNLATNADPQTTYGNDPLHARVLYDLSSFVLRDISETVEDPLFTGFSNFDVMLLDSGTTYLKEAIALSENAYIYIDDNLKEILCRNIGSYYNCLGLSLSYLGDIQQAQSAFLRALEFRPEDASVLQNLREMDANGLFINRIDYNHSFLD